MDEQYDALQAGLERLEAGEMLSASRVDLTEGDAELLEMAMMLQQLDVPERDAASVTAQRAAIMQQAMARDSVPAADSQNWVAALVSFWKSVQSWWQTRTAFQQSGFVAAGLLILILLWVNIPRADTPDVEVVEAPPPAEIESVSQAEPTVDVSELEPTAVSEAAVVEPVTAVPTPAPTTELILPVVTEPLNLNANTAAVENVRGLVEVQQVDGSWTAVSRTTLKAGQRIRTAKLSGATLTFFDGSKATIGADSELSIDELDAQPPEDGFRTVVMTQWRGESDHDVQFRNDNGSRYEVNTPTGSGIARGTQFHVLVTADLLTRFTVTEGRVDVTHVAVTVRVTAGKMTMIPVDEAPSAPQFIVSGEGDVSQTGAEWVIGGQIFQTDDNTIIMGNPQVGDFVRVTGHLLADGSRLADRIVLLQVAENGRFSLSGEVSVIDGDNWTIAGQTIGVNADTAIDPDIVVGDRVLAEGAILPDGTLLAAQVTAVPDLDSFPFQFTGVVQAMADNAWLISGHVVALTAETAVDGDIEVGDLVSVSGVILADDTWEAHQITAVEDDEAQFTLSGEVDSIDPWQVAGIGFEIRPWTVIEAGIAVGDRVQVHGVILTDGTWVATDITLIDETDEPFITFIGTISNMDPLTVNGIALVLTGETQIVGNLEVGALVRVTIRLLPDGSWTVVEIVRLDETPTLGCFTVSSVVVSVGNGRLHLRGWPEMVLGDDVLLDGLEETAVVNVTICINPDGTIVVVTIIIIVPAALPTPIPPTPQPPDDNGNGGNNARVTICHKGRQTKSVPQSALGGHLGHGDTLGPCP